MKDTTATWAAAIATIPILLPNTMDALLEKKATKFPQKSLKKGPSKKEAKAMFKQLAKQANHMTLPRKGASTVVPKTKSSPKRNKTTGIVMTLQAKIDGKLNSNRKKMKRKDQHPPRNDPDPIRANKRDEMQEEQVEVNSTMLEKTDLQPEGDKGGTSAP